MTWVKGILLVISLALNVHWATAKWPVSASKDRSVEIQRVVSETSDGGPADNLGLAPRVEERPPLPIGHLRLPKFRLRSVANLCFRSTDWHLSQGSVDWHLSRGSVEAFELSPGAESQVNQALRELQAEIYRMEVERAKKHSDWHYTLGALSKEEVNQLETTFRSDLENDLETVQAEALTALAFSHDYFFDDPYKEMDVCMMPYRDHLEVQLGSPNRTWTIPYGDTFHPLGRVKRIAHLIDFEPVWRQAFEETRNLRTAR